MSLDEHRLLRHLAIAVLLKLIVLMALWWLFFRDSSVSIDTARVAEKIGGAASSQGVSK